MSLIDSLMKEVGLFVSYIENELVEFDKGLQDAVDITLLEKGCDCFENLMSLYSNLDVFDIRDDQMKEHFLQAINGHRLKEVKEEIEIMPDDFTWKNGKRFLKLMGEFVVIVYKGYAHHPMIKMLARPVVGVGIKYTLMKIINPMVWCRFWIGYLREGRKCE